MRFGICCGPGSFAAAVKEQPLSSLTTMMQVLQDAGADYVEFAVGAVTPESPESEFEKLQAALAKCPLKVEAFNSFIPAHHRVTGPAVNIPNVLNFCRTALKRCKALGGDVVVLGSAGARKVPDGFDPVKARAQFVEFCRALGPVAQEIGIDIVLEPLNAKEDNLLRHVSDGAKLVDEIAHPRIQLLADLYHMSEEKEPVTACAEAGKRLRHTHVADLGRVAPGYATNGEEDFSGFFRNLRKAGYDRRCSFEGRFDDIAKQCKPVVQLLKKRWAESSL